jgi:hypothetical protein
LGRETHSAYGWQAQPDIVNRNGRNSSVSNNIDSISGSSMVLEPSQPTLLAQAQQGSSNTSPPDVGKLLDTLGSLATPDAAVVTTDWMKRPSARNFALLNPLAGTYTQFISHGTQTVDLLGVPVKRVESIHYSADGNPARREDGLGWAQKAGDATLFFNIRAGDTNLVNSANGASANVGFFGAPGAMKKVWSRLEQSNDPKAQLAAKVFSGLELGVAYRGTVQYNKQTKELELKVSGVSIPLPDLVKALETIPHTNEGFAQVARSNNREDYLQGANPYSLADYTRDPQDNSLRNHGDPTSAIAGNIVELGRAVNPGLPAVRTNADAKQVLEEAIDRNFAPLTTDQRRLWGQDAESLRPDPLNAKQRERLADVLNQLDNHDLDFGSQKIRDAFPSASLNPATDSPPPADRQFVRDVFEGDFRHEFAEAGNPALDIAVGLNRYVGIAASLLGGSPTARDEIILQNIHARHEGLEARLAARFGSAHEALGLDAAGLAGAELEQFNHKLTAGLASALEARMAQSQTEITGQSLYAEFAALSRQDRNAIAARLNAALR